MKIKCLTFILFYSGLTFAQKGIQLNTKDALSGYVLLENAIGTYLIDNCGYIINQWNVSNTDNHVKLLADGSIIYMKDNAVWHRDWDDDIISITNYDIRNIILDYEVIILPNGNYLCLGREVLERSEFVDLGYDVTQGFPRWMDVVVEIDPNLNSIVWMWNIKDHIIQERDSILTNYASVKANPHKLDMDAIQTFDWTSSETFMINGMDYNPDLDLIALSVRKMGEVILIDHSTSMEESRSGSGGNYNKGGDILFRWGNPENYGRGNVRSRYLYFQHNPNWIKHGEHKGKIMIFNNKLNSGDWPPYSSVEIIDPMIDSQNQFVLSSDSMFMTTEEPIRINRITQGVDFSSDYTSGAKVMPNGNIYVTVGQTNRLFEITTDGEMVWDYGIENSYYIFRSEKYPEGYLTIPSAQLEPSEEVIEFFPSSYNCNYFTTSTQELSDNEHKIRVFRSSDVQVIVKSDGGKVFNYTMLDMMGQKVTSGSDQSNYSINTKNLPAGAYVVHVLNGLELIGVQKIIIY